MIENEDILIASTIFLELGASQEKRKHKYRKLPPGPPDLAKTSRRQMWGKVEHLTRSDELGRTSNTPETHKSNDHLERKPEQALMDHPSWWGHVEQKRRKGISPADVHWKMSNNFGNNEKTMTQPNFHKSMTAGLKDTNFNRSHIDWQTPNRKHQGGKNGGKGGSSIEKDVFWQVANEKHHSTVDGKNQLGTRIRLFNGTHRNGEGRNSSLGKNMEWQLANEGMNANRYLYKNLMWELANEHLDRKENVRLANETSEKGSPHHGSVDLKLKLGSHNGSYVHGKSRWKIRKNISGNGGKGSRILHVKIHMKENLPGKNDVDNILQKHQENGQSLRDALMNIASGAVESGVGMPRGKKRRRWKRHARRGKRRHKAVHRDMNEIVVGENRNISRSSGRSNVGEQTHQKMNLQLATENHRVAMNRHKYWHHAMARHMSKSSRGSKMSRKKNNDAKSGNFGSKTDITNNINWQIETELHHPASGKKKSVDFVVSGKIPTKKFLEGNANYQMAMEKHHADKPQKDVTASKGKLGPLDRNVNWQVVNEKHKNDGRKMLQKNMNWQVSNENRQNKTKVNDKLKTEVNGKPKTKVNDKPKNQVGKSQPININWHTDYHYMQADSPQWRQNGKSNALGLTSGKIYRIYDPKTKTYRIFCVTKDVQGMDRFKECGETLITGQGHIQRNVSVKFNQISKGANVTKQAHLTVVGKNRNNDAVLKEIRTDLLKLFKLFNLTAAEIKDLEILSKNSALAITNEAKRNQNLAPDGKFVQARVGNMTAEVLKMLFNNSYLAAWKAIQDSRTIGIAHDFHPMMQQSPAHWVAWSAWSACSMSCGVTGIQIRTRVCIHGIPGRAGCGGMPSEARACRNRNPCPGMTYKIYIFSGF